MNWKTAFKQERRADWGDIAEAIRASVKIQDVLQIYAPSIKHRNNRCQCPIHNGKDLNFSYTDNGFKCFVCGASGDVISFVQTMCGLSSRVDAMKRINDDLHLGLPLNCTLNTLQSATLAQRREEHEKAQKLKTEWTKNYKRLWGEWIDLDKARMNADPESEEYADAVKRIDYVAYLIDCMPVEPR